jgi:cytochrome c5
MKKLIVAVTLAFSGAAMAAEPPASYQSSCFACHFSGAAGAPKTGDAAAWEPRLEKGMETLIASVRNGLGAMPPTGLCATCTDEQYQALIEFMATPADK